MISLQEALLWSARLICFASFLQAVELLQIRRAWSNSGIWSWTILKKELRLPMGEGNFAFILKLQMVMALVGMETGSPWSLLILFLTTVLTAWRWRGNFNGGSDAMTVIVLGTTSLALFFSHFQQVQKFCAWYLALQLVLSYFIAGLAKLLKKPWRKGQALQELLGRSNYAVPPVVQKIIVRAPLALFLSWLIIAFECSFPLVFLNSQIALVYIGGAFLFHLMNFYILGLNRFVFSWLAAYPVVYFLGGTTYFLQK